MDSFFGLYHRRVLKKSLYSLNLTITKHYVQLRRILFSNTKFIIENDLLSIKEVLYIIKEKGIYHSKNVFPV